MSSTVVLRPGKQGSSLDRKRGRMFTLLGAFIVFATFIVKDTIKENLKELLDAEDSAQTLVTIRNDYQGLNLQLRVIQKSVQQAKQFPQPGTSEQYVSDVQRYAELASRMKSIQTAVENTARLGLILPHHQNDPQIQSIGNRTKQLQNLNVRVSSAFQDEEKLLANHSDAKEVGVLIGSLLDQISKGIDPLADEANQVEHEEIDYTHTLREALESLYGFAKTASFVLYFIGWGLALFGRLYGVETGVAGD